MSSVLVQFASSNVNGSIAAAAGAAAAAAATTAVQSAARPMYQTSRRE